MNMETLKDLAADAAAAPPTDKTEAAAEDQLSPREEMAVASAKGWVPKGAFKGDPAKWVDHKTFLERAENEMPLLKASMRRLQKQNDDLHGLLKKVVSSNKEQQDRAVAQEIAKLKAEKKEAVKEGDVDKVDAIDAEIEKAKTKKVDAAEERKSNNGLSEEDSEAMNEWLDDNKWFKTDVRLNKYAEGVWTEFGKENKNGFNDKSLKEQLKIIAREVKAEFPAKFAKPKEPNAVEGGGGSGKLGAGNKGYDDLPAEAKAICDDLIKSKVIKNRAEYMKDYRF